MQLISSSPDAVAGVAFEGVAERLRGKITRAISRQKEKTKVYTRVTGEESSLFKQEAEASAPEPQKQMQEEVRSSKGLPGRAFDFVTEQWLALSEIDTEITERSDSLIFSLSLSPAPLS